MILDSLSHCNYGDMASCNIIYKEEMSNELKSKMPENFMHILTCYEYNEDKEPLSIT